MIQFTNGRWTDIYIIANDTVYEKISAICEEHSNRCSDICECLDSHYQICEHFANFQ